MGSCDHAVPDPAPSDGLSSFSPTVRTLGFALCTAVASGGLDAHSRNAVMSCRSSTADVNPAPSRYDHDSVKTDPPSWRSTAAALSLRIVAQRLREEVPWDQSVSMPIRLSASCDCTNQHAAGFEMKKLRDTSSERDGARAATCIREHQASIADDCDRVRPELWLRWPNSRDRHSASTSTSANGSDISKIADSPSFKLRDRDRSR